jgi:hypothetical protein
VAIRPKARPGRHFPLARHAPFSADRSPRSPADTSCSSAGMKIFIRAVPVMLRADADDLVFFTFFSLPRGDYPVLLVRDSGSRSPIPIATSPPGRRKIAPDLASFTRPLCRHWERRSIGEHRQGKAENWGARLGGLPGKWMVREATSRGSSSAGKHSRSSSVSGEGAGRRDLPYLRAMGMVPALDPTS